MLIHVSKDSFLGSTSLELQKTEKGYIYNINGHVTFHFIELGLQEFEKFARSRNRRHTCIPKNGNQNQELFLLNDNEVQI